MLAFPALVVQTVWCAVVLLTLGAYRTLSLRTLGTYVCVGLLLGVVAVPVVEYAFAPLYESAAGALLICAIRQLLLLAPLAPFFFRRLHRVASIADTYLLAFAVGLGYQL